MKIPLKLSLNEQQSAAAAAAQSILRDVRAIKGGDWNAKNSLVRAFQPLLLSLSEKRAHQDAAKNNRYLDADKEGLFKAARKYREKSHGNNFQLFALDFIESAMDRVDKKGGFISRLLDS